MLELSLDRLDKKNTLIDTGVCAGEAYETGIIFGIQYIGDACWAEPQENRRHANFDIYFYTEDEVWESVGKNLMADGYINEWHNHKITVGEDRYISFFVDGTLIYKSKGKLHPDILKDKKLFLGRRSSDSAGKSYHDFIKVYP